MLLSSSSIALASVFQRLRLSPGTQISHETLFFLQATHFRVDGSSKALQNNASMKGLDVLSILRRAAVEHP
jgi:hypothetical protein